jgi:hypothetical protein
MVNMVENFNPKSKVLHLKVEIQPGWAVWHRYAYSRSGSNSCTENQLKDGEIVESFQHATARAESSKSKSNPGGLKSDRKLI